MLAGNWIAVRFRLGGEVLRQSSQKLVVVLCSLREQKLHFMLCSGV